MTLFLISLAAGVLTVLAPCVLPLLPVIVGSSVNGELSRKKAFIVTGSLGVSVVLFTLLLKASTAFINIPQSTWTILSGSIVTFFGLITLFPAVWERIGFLAKLNARANKVVGAGYQKESVWGDVLIGAALGPIFSTCSPTYFVILATVLPQSPVAGFVDLLAYTAGLCGALLFIVFAGQKLVSKLDGASNPHGWFKRSLGALLLIVGIAILFGIDKKIEVSLLSNGLFDITKIEQALLQKNLPQQVSSDETKKDIKTSSTNPPPTTQKPVVTTESLAVKSLKYPRAPELVNPSGFVNTAGKPVTLAQFKGKKVVLLDVWTYSCINCQRTLPYVNAWYEKYAAQGLEIVGLHTPEFAFEKVQSNVEAAVKRFNIKYPVVLDNDYATWNAYGNQYWPRKYLIDIDGYVVYDHIGEGSYEETEMAIQKALAERATMLDAASMQSSSPVQPKNVIMVDTSKVHSPETYFGSARNEYFGSGKRGVSGVGEFSAPGSADTNASAIKLNTLYLDGTWNIQPEYAESQSATAKIVYRYSTKNVYLVMAANAAHPGGVKIKVLRDGKPLGAEAGEDVSSIDSTATIRENRLYKLVNGADYGEYVLEIQVEGPGLEAFAFTFG